MPARGSSCAISQLPFAASDHGQTPPVCPPVYTVHAPTLASGGAISRLPLAASRGGQILPVCLLFPIARMPGFRSGRAMSWRWLHIEFSSLSPPNRPRLTDHPTSALIAVHGAQDQPLDPPKSV